MARIDKLLLARYGIIQPVSHGDFHVVAPLDELNADDRRDLMEFAQMMCEVDEGQAVTNDGDNEDDEFVIDEC